MLGKEMLATGIGLLRQPVLPLVTIVQFLYLTGDFMTPVEVMAQLPDEIETGFACYRDPARMLEPFADLLRPLADFKAGLPLRTAILDPAGHRVDGITAATALVAQAVLERELTAVNSILCAPCGCTLCCVGPTAAMAQSYFEIPLALREVDRFAVRWVDTDLSRPVSFGEEQVLRWDGSEVEEFDAPTIVRWQHGASLILPKETACPNLTVSGLCQIYPDRPEVCRKPQIFAYMLEPVDSLLDNTSTLCLRQSLLAVVDCPYVALLRDEIAAYAAACELELVFRRNKA